MANVFSIILCIGEYLWDYKIQILGSFFVVLSIFEYSYEKYLRAKRKKIVKK